MVQTREKAQKVVDFVKNNKPTPDLSPEAKASMQQFFAPYNQRLYDILKVEPYWVYENVS